VVVGWTDPEGSRPRLGALLLAYYTPDGRLVYAGRAGVGINNAELERLWRRLKPLATSDRPLDVPPPRTSRFGSPLVLSRVHWVRPELVAEVKYLTWTDENPPAGHLPGSARGQGSDRGLPSGAKPTAACGASPTARKAMTAKRVCDAVQDIAPANR
jgi:ATP-dependent DNA ligase